MTDFSRGPVSTLSLSPTSDCVVAAAGRDHLCISPVPSSSTQSPQSLPPNPKLTPISSVSSVCYADVDTIYAADTKGSWTRLKPNLDDHSLSLEYTIQGAHGGAELTRIAALSSTSSVVTSGRDATIRIWDPQTKQSITRLKGHKYEVRAVAMASSHDGNSPVTLIASAGRDKTVRLWDVRASNSSNVHVFQGHTGWVHDVAMASTPSPLIVSCAGDKTVRVWDLVAGKQRNVFKGHDYRVWAVAIAPEAHFALSASTDATVRLWHLDEDSDINQNDNILEGHQDTVLTVAVDRYGRFALSGCEDGTLYRWTCPKPFAKEMQEQLLISLEDESSATTKDQQSAVPAPPGLDTEPLIVEKQETSTEPIPSPITEDPLPTPTTTDTTTGGPLPAITVKTKSLSKTEEGTQIVKDSEDYRSSISSLEINSVNVQQDTNHSPNQPENKPITTSSKLDINRPLPKDTEALKAAIASSPEQDSEYDKSAAELVNALQTIKELEKSLNDANEKLVNKDKQIMELNSTVTKQASEISHLIKKLETTEKLAHTANVRSLLEKDPRKADISLDYDEPVNKIGAVSDQLTALAARLDAMIATN